jgi:ribonucleoside-diphosphate reductase alpha chain
MDHPKAFSEILYLLLGGTGVGYSVQERHISNLPPVLDVASKELYQHQIEDSIEGWADAVDALINAYFHPFKGYPIFDFSLIREKGSPIKTAGGLAPGSEPLQEALVKINNLLYNAQGRFLTPIEVFDINNHLAQAVYSGGIRRSATICLFDKDDVDMLYSKSGDWYTHNPQRVMANISAVLNHDETNKDDFKRIFNILKTSGSGEPGFYWTNDSDLGVNPCCEISLRSCTFCNLTEVNVSAIESQEDFQKAAEAAVILGTFQATYTNLKNLRPIWKQRTEEDALIGISLTGIASYKDFPFSLTPVAESLKKVNSELASKLNINPAKRITTIKPSGTASLFFGTSSGIHPYYSRYYLRRIRVNKNEPVYPWLKTLNPSFIEDDLYDPNSVVFSVPVKAPETAITSEEGALEMLKRIRFFYHEWVKPGHVEGLNTNNISATVYVRKKEWDDVEQFLWEYRFSYHGITLLPFDGHTYKQAPLEEIPLEKYEDLIGKLSPINFSHITETSDKTNLSHEIACSGGSCEVTSL